MSLTNTFLLGVKQNCVLTVRRNCATATVQRNGDAQNLQYMRELVMHRILGDITIIILKVEFERVRISDYIIDKEYMDYINHFFCDVQGRRQGGVKGSQPTPLD